ncbi:hypothetical protein GCM10020331_063590 [Ectobacillus funiculus]
MKQWKRREVYVSKIFLASVGIGAAKVDTVLQRDEWAVGEEVKGLVHIAGGAVEQKC